MKLDENKNDNLKYFTAHIRVVKELINQSEDNRSFFGNTFDSVEILKENHIQAKDEKEVKEILANKYPQFFPNGKVYTRSTKDQAQFFYVLIFDEHFKGHKPYTCSHCGYKGESVFLDKPYVKYNESAEPLYFCYDREKSFDEGCCYNKYKDSIRLGFLKSGGFIGEESFIKEKDPICIYKITNKNTGKCYIGKTKNHPIWRWWNHLTKNNSPFGIALSSTPLNYWTFEILEELPYNTDNKKVLEIESSYMIKFDSINNGYNSVISNVIAKERENETTNQLTIKL